jgi:hypothetical protein
MSRGIASLSRWLAALVMAVSIPWVLTPTSAAATGVSVQVAAVTQTVTNAPASQTPATAGCAPGTVLVGGGIRVFHAAGDQIVTSTVYEPPERGPGRAEVRNVIRVGRGEGCGLPGHWLTSPG